MRKRIILTVPLLFLATAICHAHSLTLKEADSIIIILLFVVIALIVVVVVGRRQHKISLRREEQLLRILNMLDEYRAMMADGILTLDEQEELLKRYQPEVKKAKVISIDERKAFYVKMDARVNKEKPFTDPDFNQQALADFMEVDLETIRRLVPRYENADRTLDYINSLRAEYAAKLLMEQSGLTLEDMAGKCGFRNTAAFLNAFKFAFGITPTDYLNSMNQMFKKKAQ